MMKNVKKGPVKKGAFESIFPNLPKKIKKIPPNDNPPGTHFVCPNNIHWGDEYLRGLGELYISVLIALFLVNLKLSQLQNLHLQ